MCLRLLVDLRWEVDSKAQLHPSPRSDGFDRRLSHYTWSVMNYILQFIFELLTKYRVFCILYTVFYILYKHIVYYVLYMIYYILCSTYYWLYNLYSVLLYNLYSTTFCIEILYDICYIWCIEHTCYYHCYYTHVYIYICICTYIAINTYTYIYCA